MARFTNASDDYAARAGQHTFDGWGEIGGQMRCHMRQRLSLGRKHAGGGAKDVTHDGVRRAMWEFGHGARLLHPGQDHSLAHSPGKRHDATARGGD
jgi:hypothetical protein